MFMNIKDEENISETKRTAEGKDRSPRKEKIQESGFSATTMHAQDRTGCRETSGVCSHL